MTKKGFKHMKGRLTFWLLIVALLPLCIVVLITSYQRYHAIKEREFSKLIAIRDLKVEQLNRWFEERLGDIRTMGEDPELRDLETRIQQHGPKGEVAPALERARNLLKRYLRNYPDYAEIFIVNPLSGRVELSTDPSSEGEEKSGRDYFAVPLKTGRFFIQDIYYSGKVKGPCMAVSIPIFHPDPPKNALGILVARIDLNPSLYHLLLNRAGMGGTGESLIVNEDQTVLNELRWHENAPLRLKIASEPTALAVQGKTGIVEGEDYRGVPVLAAYTFLPRPGWGFVVKEDLSEAYAPVYTMFWQIGFLFVLAAACVYALAVYLARTIARPVKEMAEVSKKIKGGDLKARNHIESRDELGLLAESFNSMAASLALHEELRHINDEITQTMVDAKDLPEFRMNILKKLVAVTQSQMGVYFLLNRETGMYEPFFSIGLDADLLKAYDASRLEGDVGMVVETQQTARITDIPRDSIFTFKTFTGDFLPKEIISIPMVTDSVVTGIVSLASIKPYPRKVLEIMEQPWTTGFGTALANMYANEETARLAKELKAANQKLQAQAEELQAQNEELESQSEEIRQNAEELQEQNLELEAQKEQVESADRLKSEFLSNMSHELRTPLNSVMALSRVLTLQAKEKLSEEERSYLEIIERNGRNLLSLINDILDLSKIEAGRMDIHPRPFSVISTIETILERLEPMAREKKIQLRHALPEELPPIESDEARVQQILQNLIANAVKFTEEGSVAITGSTDGDHIAIKISDTGIGIPKKDLPHIFEEFRQVDGTTARPYEGTGLGLAIAHKTAHMLGGEVTVESLVGKGSTFTLTLPVKPRCVMPVSEPLTLKPVAGGKRSRPGVLVIDDEPEAAAMISNYLSREGYAVMTATSGKEGVRLARKHRPFAITLDIIMPDMDGWEVLQALKQHPETKDIPVIVVSISHDRETGMALGAVGFITKPVNQARLMAEIRSIDGPTPHAVLIVDDDAIDRQEMARMVAEEGMDAIVAENGAQCMERLKEALPDVMVLDLMMPEVDGFEVLRRVRSDPDVQAVPVIVVTAKDLTDEDRAQLSGNVFSVLTKSDTTSRTLLEELKRLLFELVGAPPALNTPQRLLLVEDNEAAVIQVRSVLQGAGYTVDVVRDGQEALDYVAHTLPDGVILDLMMPKVDGFEVLEKIRGTAATAHIPVLILTAKDLSPQDLEKLSANNIQQLIHKGDVDREGLLQKTADMLGVGVETGNWKLETGDWKFETGNLKLETGNSKLETGNSKLERGKRDGALPASAGVQDQVEEMNVQHRTSNVEHRMEKSVPPQTNTQYPMPNTRYSILVIEDNPDNMTTIKAILKDRYSLLEAGDGESGLKTALSRHPSLILLDMSLPGMDGFEVVTKLKRNPDLHGIPVIALTAHAMKGDRERMIEAGCDDYISKPVEPEEVLEKVEGWVGEGAYNLKLET